MEAMAQRRQNIIDTVKVYGSKLFGFIRSRVPNDEDAEDILQDVWYQLSNQSELGAIESISGWLYRVAKNKITDRSRKKQASSIEDLAYENEEGELLLPQLFVNTNDPSTADLKKLFWEELLAALDELPEKQRTVFIRNEIEEMTLQEIADMDNENIKTIISRKRYAVQHLRNRLEYLYNEFVNY